MLRLEIHTEGVSGAEAVSEAYASCKPTRQVPCQTCSRRGVQVEYCDHSEAEFALANLKQNSRD